MLIGSEGEKHGIVTIKDALETAKKASLDLVQVSPSSAEPVVCKLLDYGKHIFDRKKISQHLESRQKKLPQKK
jgi:translation initiation factor IF-3